MSDTDRTRTYSWQDPLPDLMKGKDLSGMDYLRKIVSGEFVPPPISRTLDYTLVELEDGRAVFEGTPGEYCYNPIGVIHGGYAMTLLDSAVACAIHTKLPPGMAYSTAQINFHFVRPLTKDTGLVRAEGRLIYVGKQMGTAEGTLTDAQGKLYAHATTTCMIFPMRA